MIYKNTIKILFSNFDIVWKSMLYYILNFALIGGLVYLCLTPVYNSLVNSGIISDALAIYTDFITNLNLPNLFASLSELIDNGWQSIVDNISSLWFTFVALATVLIFLKSLFYTLPSLPACNSLHYYMGSMNKMGFYTSFRDCFWRSLKVQLIQFVVLLPIKVALVALFVLLLKLFNYSFIVSVLAVILIIVLFVLLFALKETIFAGWIPTIVILNYGVFKSLKVSVKNSCKNFKNVFGGAVGIVISIALLNIVLVPFTFSVGIIISLPASYLIYNIFGMVIVYEEQGMRYYVDVYNVITPKKREIRDKLKEMKFVI